MSAPGRRDAAVDWLGRVAGRASERVAITDPDSEIDYTYGDLDRRADAVATGLAALGVRRNDRVAVLAHNGVEILDLLFACGRLGAVLVPLNWRLAEGELAGLIDDAQPAVVVAESEYAALVARIAPSAVVIDKTFDFPSLLGAQGRPARVDVRLDDPWMILYTGGTTGVPKGAVLTHGSVLWNAINTNVSWGLSEREVAPCFTPMFHTGGLNVFTLPPMLLGARVILPRRFDATQALRILQDRRVTVMFMVPTMFERVAAESGFADADLSHIRWAISGGAPLPREIAQPWKAKIPVFKQGYGLTEVGPNNFATSDVDGRRGMDHTVGKLTVFAQARIVDDNGVDVSDGEVGELLLAGPHMCAGYWRRPDETAHAIRDGWFHTGDIASRDREGYYRIVDRKKEMIITGGENVFPTEVEAVLYVHPAVREAAVVGVLDPRWGEAVRAVVSLKSGRAATSDALRDFCRGKLAGYKVPKAIDIVGELPKSAAGKIVRAEAKKLIVG